MSKRILAVLMTLAMLVMAFAGCAGERGPSYIEGCVTRLGQYKDMTVTVTDSETEERVKDLYYEHAVYDVSTEGKVEADTVLSLTRSAAVDGEVIDALALNGKAYTLGHSGNIPGFDDALVGLNIGEETEITVDVPSDFEDASIAGKTVKFTVTPISARIYPEMDDENVYNALGEEYQVETLSAFRGYCRESIYAEKLLDAIVSDTEVDHYVEQDYTAYKNHFQDEYHNDYDERVEQDYTGTYDEYCREFQGKSADELDAEVEQGARDYALKRTVIYAVCEDAGIEASDDLIQNYAVNAFDAAGYATPKAFIKAVGREYLRYEITLSALEAFYSYILDANTCVSE